MTEMNAVAEILRAFLRRREKVLVCYASGNGGTLWQSAAEAAKAMGADVVLWDAGQSWQSLLRQVFSQRVTVLIGAPKLILGLAKIARATATPLPVRHAVLLGRTEEEWLLKGIRESLDAVIHIYSASDANDPLMKCDPLLRQLDAQLLSWSSILDYRAERTEQGLSLEIVVFSGRQLPNLPSGAKVAVRPWRPGEDSPYCWINAGKSLEFP